MRRQTTYNLVRLAPADLRDDWGVYSSTEFGILVPRTPLVFRGTQAECEAAYLAATRDRTPWNVLTKRAKLARKRAARRAAGVGG